MCIRDRSIPHHWGELADTVPIVSDTDDGLRWRAKTSVITNYRPRPNSPANYDSNYVDGGVKALGALFRHIHNATYETYRPATVLHCQLFTQ